MPQSARHLHKVASALIAAVLAIAGTAAYAADANRAGDAKAIPKPLPATVVTSHRQANAARIPVAPKQTKITFGATTPSEVTGVVTSPVVGKLISGDPQTAVLTFSGTVNTNPRDWILSVDVLRSADADPAVEDNWQYAVATFLAERGGPEYFSFYRGGIMPFLMLPDAWKPGGLGRLRVAAVLKSDGSQRAILPAVDADGIVPANPTTIVLADISPNPTLPAGESLSTIRNAHNPKTPNYLNANSEVLSFPPDSNLQAASALSYYDQVKIGDQGGGNSVRQQLPKLIDFINHYFRPFECVSPDNSRGFVTRYFNNGDLGIGREMHCINRGCTGELACYVKNFAGLESSRPIFNDKQLAYQAMRDNRPFATVAMVERQRVASSNRVFFVVYEHINADGNPANTKLALKAPLDNKQYNTSIPGNCLQCHGINASYKGGAVHDVQNAQFLPFDLDAFQFFSDDPASPLSRARQEPAFRAHNRMIASFTQLSSSPEVTSLIQGWYDGDLTNGIFDGTFVPTGWRTDDKSQQLYRKVFAHACRTCHISYRPSATDNRPYLRFDSPSVFGAVAKGVMCSPSHTMPAAEQTLKVFWRSTARPQFYAQVPGAFGDCAP